jgi:hypothetical protein
VATSRNPGKGPGGHGTTSDFGSLDGWSLVDSDAFLQSHADLDTTSITSGGYRHYKFKDKSELVIRPNGEIIRLPHAMYNPDGTRVRGLRLNLFTGQLISSLQWHQIPRTEQEWVVI